MKGKNIATDLADKLIAIVMNKTQCDKATANTVAHDILFEVQKDMLDPLYDMIEKLYEKYKCTEVD